MEAVRALRPACASCDESLSDAASEPSDNQTVAAVIDQAIDAAIDDSASIPAGTPPTLIRMLLDTMGRSDPVAVRASVMALTLTEQVRDEALNVLMAARDTTASLMASLFYELARNPADWQRARAEVIALLGTDGILAFEDVKRLKFLRGAINEALRSASVSLPALTATACTRPSLPIAGSRWPTTRSLPTDVVCASSLATTSAGASCRSIAGATSTVRMPTHGGPTAGSDQRRPIPARRRSKRGATDRAWCAGRSSRPLTDSVHRSGARCAVAMTGSC